jgi:hypothetical protein
MEVKNTFRVNTGNSSGGSIFTLFDRVINLDSWMEKGIPVKLVPHVLFVSLICIFYIGNNHYAEKITRRISKLEVEVDELRSEYISQKAEYMYSSKQSEVAKKVKAMKLEESSEPPFKIIVEK